MARFRIALIAVLVFLPVVAPASENGSKEQIHEIIADRIDRLEQSVGIVVGWVDENGRLIVGHGKVGPDNDATPDGDTVFEIGSVTKVFTGILLADMVRTGDVQLRDPVRKYLPQSVHLPVRGERPITLYDLATHTSGLPRMPDNFSPADPMNPYADYTAEKMYTFLSAYELPRDPGAEAAYSNLGMGLLGYVLALKEETDYESLVRKRVTGPLGMNETMIRLTPALNKRFAKGHDGGLQPVSAWDIDTLAGAGALRSTAHDMLKFVEANLGLVDTKLSVSLNDAQKPREDLGEGGGTRVGLAWFVSSKDGKTITWHNGQTGGFHSFVGFDRENRRGVVVLSNSSASIDDIGYHLLEPSYQLRNSKAVKVIAKIPSTPAGDALNDWLKATRSPDDEVARAHYEAAFADSFKAGVPLDTYMAGRVGLRMVLLSAEVEQVASRTDHELTAYVDSNGTWFAIDVVVSPDEPHAIEGLLIQPRQPPKARE